MSKKNMTRMVFPTNTNNIQNYYDRMEYIFDEFRYSSFTTRELMERYNNNPKFEIKAKTMQSTVSSLYSLGLLEKVGVHEYKISRYGRKFVSSSPTEDKEFYNDFLEKISRKYSCVVRNNEIKSYQMLIRLFHDLNGTVYKHELLPLFFVSSNEEYEIYIETIKRARIEHNNQIIFNYIDNLLEEEKIEIDDIRQIANRDINGPICLLKTLGFVKNEIIHKGNSLELPGGYEINTETYYKFSEEGFDKYFTEEETVAIYVEEMGDFDENIPEENLPFNNKNFAKKKTVVKEEYPRNKEVQAYVIKKHGKKDFFEEIESTYGHPAPNVGGKPAYEVHHTVPMSLYKDFKKKGYNIDITMLCIAICKICHIILHDKKNGEKELKTKLVEYMYENKKNELLKYAGIQTYKEFAKLYNL